MAPMTAPTAMYTVPLGLLAAFNMNGFPIVDGGVILGTTSDEDDVVPREVEGAEEVKDANDGSDLELVWDATLDVDFDTVIELVVVVASVGRSLLTSDTDGIKFFLTIFADVSF